MSQYARLTLSCRKTMQNMDSAGRTKTDIAVAIGVHQSTVSRELRRLDTGYSATDAHVHVQRLITIP